MTTYENIVVEISRSFHAALNARCDTVIRPNERHTAHRLLAEAMSKTVKELGIADLASILPTIPEMDELEVGDEFYGAPAILLIRAVVTSALRKTFSHVFNAIHAQDATVDSVNEAVCWKTQVNKNGGKLVALP